ncbi:MAG: hypothetical protein IMY71_13690 [Bacteroidetes bacterium]|nr:hypothetical protein [Bacteroidota bacterium]
MYIINIRLQYMSSVFTHKLKWFSFILIIFFVCNGVLGQVSSNEKSTTKNKLLKYLASQENSRQITNCCPELSKDIDPDVSLESWMLEENFGLDVLSGESEVPLRQWMISNKTWNNNNSKKSSKGLSELKTLNYIKQK